MELNYLNDKLEGKAVYYYEDGNMVILKNFIMKMES